VNEEALEDLTDEELASLVRNTATFRAAASCARFAEEAQELRENDSLAFDRLVRETHEQQSSSVSKEDTTRTIISAFLDTVEQHAALNEETDDAAEEAAEEVVEAEP